MSMWPSEVAQLCKEYTGKVYIRRQRINAAGYTSDHVYFGHGSPLYYVMDEDCIWEDYIRASDREDAIAQVRERYPLAKIKR